MEPPALLILIYGGLYEDERNTVPRNQRPFFFESLVLLSHATYPETFLSPILLLLFFSMYHMFPGESELHPASVEYRHEPLQ